MVVPQLGTVLVVGGSGFLGSHIVDRLLSGNYAVRIAVTSRAPKAHSDARVTCHAADITSQSAVEALLQEIKPDVVIHTVSPHPHSPAKVLNAANVTGTENLLKASKHCKNTKAFVYTSSDSACDSPPFRQVTESECKLYDSKHYNNHYGRTKALADALVLSSNSKVLRTATIRVPGIYGENDPNFIAQIVKSIKAGKHKEQVGPDKKMWDFVYAPSAAEAHILAAKALIESREGADGQAFFITDNVPLPFFAFYRKCCAAAGYPVKQEEIRVNPFWLVKAFASAGEWIVWLATFGQKLPELRRQDIDHLDTGRWWSTAKAERVLGYKPILGQDEAVKKSMEWGMKTS